MQKQREKKLSELQCSDQAEDREKALNIQWRDMLHSASGVRSKYLNVSHLRKKIKIRDNLKTRSEKAWKSRTNFTISKLKKKSVLCKKRTNKEFMVKNDNKIICQSSHVKKDMYSRRDPLRSVNGNFSVSKSVNKYQKNRAGFEGKRYEFLNKKCVTSKKKSVNC